ncbi:MAG: hypothetical protein HUU19_14030 [Phycisphaerales bacterium]|nr:hypothetical protein [Phycisphaerales bacterium]
MSDEESIFDQLVEIPSRYAKLTTELSNRLAAVEERLNQLPSKAEVTVAAVFDRQVWLRFARAGRDRWSILYMEGAPGVRVNKLDSLLPAVELPVKQKILATRALPLLLKELVAAQGAGIGEVEEGLRQLSKVERSLGMKEGQ